MRLWQFVALGLLDVPDAAAFLHPSHQMLEIVKDVQSKETIDSMRDIIQSAAQDVAEIYNCTISIAMKNRVGTIAAAYRHNEFRGKMPASIHDKFAFGSLTKMITGASIMKMISEGRLHLDDRAEKLVDPALVRWADADPAFPFRSMADLWGKYNVRSVTVEDLLGMMNGFPDFDTASPCVDGRRMECPDELRLDLFNHPTHAYSPQELLNFSWVKNHYAKCESKWKEGDRIWARPFCYSTTGFLLLGIILSEVSGAKSTDLLDQKGFFPAGFSDEEISFIKKGTAASHGIRPGHDRTRYNLPFGQRSNHTLSGVAGVFSGWTGSNMVGTPTGIAKAVWEIYGPQPSFGDKQIMNLMIPNDREKPLYGLATQNIGGTGFDLIGQYGRYGKAYGHMGSTYGYQSAGCYFSKLRMAIGVASDLEAPEEGHAILALCFAYNRLAGFLLGKNITCEQAGDPVSNFETPSAYWGGGCNCTLIEPHLAERKRKEQSMWEFQ